MVWRLVALALACGQPVPDEQTAEQQALFLFHEQRAQAASAAATHEVMSFLESTSFRAVLRECCPDLANESSLELLRRYRAEAKAAELAHAFPADAVASLWPDVTIREMDFPWFLNEWQAALLHDSFNASEGPQVVNDLMQQELYGCRPFNGSKPTWKEAAERLIYVAHNMRRLDFASMPSFGDATAVFNTTYVQKMVLLSPYDTGQYGMSCKHQGVPEGFPLPQLNCSSWGEVVGTLEHLDHLILPNLYMFGNWSAPGMPARNRTVWDNTRSLLTRSALSKAPYQALPPTDVWEAIQYMEANILGNPRLPKAVQFLIGNAATLLGTTQGRELRLLAMRQSWPLMWAWTAVMSPPWTKTSLASFPGQRRLLDPVVGRLNATGDQAQFEDLWKRVEQLRSTRNITNTDLDTWWQEVSLSQVLVEPLTAARPCPEHCVARALKGPCVCRASEPLVLQI